MPRAVVTVFGDSKTEGDAWPGYLVDLIDPYCDNAYLLAPIAVGGVTAAYWETNLAASLASYSGTPTVISMNLGTNDARFSYGGVPTVSEAEFKASIANILDQFHAKWPSALIYVDRIWTRGYTDTSATINTWTSAVVADGRTTWAKPGTNEPVWLENGDDGTTYTLDGIHYSDAGMHENAAQKKTAMGL